MAIDFNDNQENPLFLLVETQIQTQQLQVGVQGADELVLTDYSNGAATAMENSDTILKNMAALINTKNIQSTTVTQYQAEYSTLQTQVSNLNNQYSNNMQGQGTIVTDSTQTQQFTLSILSAVIQAVEAVPGYIGQWSR